MALFKISLICHDIKRNSSGTSSQKILTRTRIAGADFSGREKVNVTRTRRGVLPACMPRELCFVCGLSFLFIFNNHLTKDVSRSIRPIFTKFHHYGRCLIVDYTSDPHFPMAQETLSWQPILGSKWAKSDYSPLFVALTFRSGLQYRHSVSGSLSMMIWLHCV